VAIAISAADSALRSPFPFSCRDSNVNAIGATPYEPGRQYAAKLLTRNEARRIATNIGKLPGLLQRPAGATNEKVLAICERVAEVQALLHDYLECGKHSAADVIAKAQAVL
jgi:hypothetical protein